MSFTSALNITNSVLDVANGFVTGYMNIKAIVDSNKEGNNQYVEKRIEVNEKLDEETERLLQEKALSDIERNKILNAFILQKLANDRRLLFKDDEEDNNTVVIVTALFGLIGIFTVMINKMNKNK